MTCLLSFVGTGSTSCMDKYEIIARLLYIQRYTYIIYIDFYIRMRVFINIQIDMERTFEKARRIIVIPEMRKFCTIGKMCKLVSFTIGRKGATWLIG